MLALVVTSALTLLAAAGVLLDPLEHRLRDQTRRSLQAAVQSARGQLVDALNQGRADPPSIVERLHTRTNSEGALYDINPAIPSTMGRPQLTPPPQPDDQISDVYAAYFKGSRKTVVDQTGSEIRITVGLAMPARNGHFYVLTIHKQDQDLAQIVREVQRAFATAALIGFAVAVMLGLILSATLSRRIGVLRQVARRIVREGPDAPAPSDRRRDELGDLARAMAEMQQALRRQEEARRRFVATASHELRTPLTSLIGTLELLAEDLGAARPNIPDAREQTEAARADLERLRGLATELLDLSRLDAGVELRAEPVDLGELARAVAAEFRTSADERRTTIEVTIPPGPCWGQGDPDAVARIARILLDNALHYTPPGSQIVVSIAYHGESATLSVADDGPGVAPAEQTVIFERFRRGEHRASVPGFGLGLAIARELATRLGGSLDLRRDEAPGACFVLRLAADLPGGRQAARADGSASDSYAVDGVRR